MTAPDYIDDNNFLNSAKRAVLPPPIPWNGKSQQFIATKDDPFITPLEASDFKHTPEYSETIAYLKKLEKASNSIKLITLPEKTDTNQDFYMAIVSNSKDKSIVGLKKDSKPLIYVEAGIHPGEANGKDAGLMFIRDMLVNNGKQKDLLNKVNLLFVPVVNIDGDMRYGKYGRITQAGPDETGWRVNSRNLNLNRDFAKLDSPEIRNVAHVLTEYEPDFFMDVHSTDGINYQYDVTYCNNGTGWSPESNAWMDKIMTPKVFSGLEAYGHIPNVCISMNDDEDVTKGYYPYYSDLIRFSNQYADVRGIPGILVELHAIKPYKQQVLGNYVLYQEIFNSISDNYDSLKKAIAKDRLALEKQKTVTLTWRQADGKPQLVPFKGVEGNKVISPITGDEVILWTNKPKTYQVPITPFVTPDLVVQRPAKYIVPVAWHDVIARLRAHGIKMTELDKAKTLDVTIYRLDDVKLGTPFEPDRESADKIPGYEGKLLISGKPVAMKRKVTYLPGSVEISTDQKLGVLAMALLEPQSPDSFLHWGFFNATLSSAESSATYVLEPMARKMLEESPALKKEFETKLKNSKDFAKDRNARLLWFYEKTPFADTNRFVYPVGKVIN